MSLLSLLVACSHLKSIHHSIAKNRIGIYIEILYNWATLMHYVPFKCTFSNRSPPIICLIKNSKRRTLIGITSFIVVISSIVHLNLSLLFFKPNQIEAFLVVGISCLFIALASSQLCMLHPYTQSQGISLINSMLEDYYKEACHASWLYELICLTMSCIGIVYPILYFPLGYTIHWFLPDIFIPLANILEKFAIIASFGQENIAHITSLSLYYGYMTVLAAGLGHAAVNFVVVCHWICTYLFTTSSLLHNLRNSTAENPNMEREYLRIKVSFKLFITIFGNLVSSWFFLGIIIIIVLTYVMLQRHVSVPMILTIGIFLADLSATIVLYALLDFITNTHFSSQSVVERWTNKVSGLSGYRLEFWKGISPIRMEFAGVCSCETREFLLIVWMDVILQSVIDLLMTFWIEFFWISDNSTIFHSHESNRQLGVLWKPNERVGKVWLLEFSSSHQFLGLGTIIWFKQTLLF